MVRVLRDVELYSYGPTLEAGPPGTGVVSVERPYPFACPQCGGRLPMDGDPVCTCGSAWGQRK